MRYQRTTTQVKVEQEGKPLDVNNLKRTPLRYYYLNVNMANYIMSIKMTPKRHQPNGLEIFQNQDDEDKVCPLKLMFYHNIEVMVLAPTNS